MERELAGLRAKLDEDQRLQDAAKLASLADPGQLQLGLQGEDTITDVALQSEVAEYRQLYTTALKTVAAHNERLQILQDKLAADRKANHQEGPAKKKGKTTEGEGEAKEEETQAMEDDDKPKSPQEERLDTEDSSEEAAAAAKITKEKETKSVQKTVKIQKMTKKVIISSKRV